jgi:rubrerythrin
MSTADRTAASCATFVHVDKQQAINRLMGLAVFGEMVAARTYNLMAQLKSEYSALLKKFAGMEGQHATWFRDASRINGIEPDKEFADGELDYLIDQVNDHHAAKDFDALAVVQGFIVESLAIATYEPFLSVADQYPGARDAFQKALDEERYHVDWVTRYLRLAFFDREDEFVALAGRVNVQGIDCIGGTMMKIADYLSEIGLSGADCAGCMMDGYTELLERVGVEQKKAAKNVVGMFMPLIHKYRHGMKIK